MKNSDGWLETQLWRFIVKFAGRNLARQVWRGILGREANAAETTSCMALIQREDSISPLLENLLGSSEFRQKNFAAAAPGLVQAAYEGILGRAPDPEGLKAHTARLLKHHDVASLLREMTASPEFERKALSRQPSSRPAASPAKASVPTVKASVPPIAAAPASLPDKGRLVIVSGNCQTGGVAAALQACLPYDTILPLPLPEGRGPDAEKRFVAELSNADVWVAGWDLSWARKLGFKEKAGFQFIKIPAILFPAFHPDFTRARRVSDNKATVPGYSSGIGVWAYNRGLDAGDARKLFNRESYAGLGYLSLWNPSVAAMKSSFAECDLDFGRFMLAVKRRGTFMHTINHPKVHVLIDLAKLVAVKMGCSEAIFEREITINDALTSEVWPLFPEVADELSLPHGSYDWKVGNKALPGIEAYLQHAFTEYAKQEMPRGGMKLVNRDQNLYDRVLGPQAGVTV